MTSRSSKSNGNPVPSIHIRHPLNASLIGDFKIGQKLGQGTFSKVCQGIHLPTGEKVAIKIMSKDQIKEKSDKIRIEKEINIQKKLHHQNIVQQYAIIETESTIYIISEYCSGGELFDYIVSKRKLYEVEACRIYQQLISGLEYLHKQRICHRDLKPENLLFDSKHNLKIADFGLSNDYHKGKLSTPCGSPCYAAPEMVTGRKYGGSSVDIWSSGIVLYTMVCGFLPFEDDNQNILFSKIAKGLFSLPSFLSQSCKDLLKKILVTDPKKRFGFEEIKHHPWFLSVNNVMGKNIFFNSPGVFIDEDVLPVDVEIIAEIHNDFHISNEKIINDVIKNRHNKITTAYYLILKRKIRNGETSVADIGSNSNSFIKYIKSPISKMGYWNSDYEKINQYYTKLVKKYLNLISEDNTLTNGSNNKNNNFNLVDNKENQNTNNLNQIENNTERLKLNSDKISQNTELADIRCHTELSQENKISNSNLAKNEEKNKVQNGVTDIVSTIYDDTTKMVTIKDYRDKGTERHNYSMDFEDSEEPTQQKINESYRPKITIQGFLQTDANNIKINARLINDNNMRNKFDDKSNILKSKESITIKDINNTNSNNNINYCETKEKENQEHNINRIMMTEVDNIGVKNIEKSLLNKNNNNNSIETYSKKMVNNKPKNINLNINLKTKTNIDDYIKLNTLYNKDDSDDLSYLKKEYLNSNNDKSNDINNLKYINNKTDLTINNNIIINTNIPKLINGLNENKLINLQYNVTQNRTKSVEKNYENIKISNDINIAKEKEKNKLYISLPINNQIYKQEKILKFINTKTSSMPKTKEDSKKDIRDLEKGKVFINNKNKYKNRYSQEPINPKCKHIYGINTNNISLRQNGANEINYINKNNGIYSRLNNFNIGNLLYVKKKRKPKSIDDNINRKNLLLNKKDSKNMITNNNNNKEIYLKVNNINNYEKQLYRDKIYDDQKTIEEGFLSSFRYKKINNKIGNINNLKRKGENDFNSISNASHRIDNNPNSLYLNSNNFILDKNKREKNKNIYKKEIVNYGNISSLNKNHKLHEHNSFDAPKKNKIKQSYINNSIEKNKNIINNNPLLSKNGAYNNNYYKLNKKIKYYYRNIGTSKQNQPSTQYYGINNYSKIINNYDIDNLDKIINEKIQAKNQRINYKISNNNNKIKANSLDLKGNKTIRTNNDKNSNKIKHIKKPYLNTSVVKDKTPKNFITSFYKEKNKLNNLNRKNYYLNTIENNNLMNITHKFIDENRYMTFWDNESISTNSTRKAHFQKYLFPAHKRYNFSQEPERRRKDNNPLDIYTPYGKVNSIIFHNMNKNNIVFKKDKKKINNISSINKEPNMINNTNKIIYSKVSIDKIKDIVENNIGNKIEVKKNKNIIIFDCKYKEGNNIINFRLNLSKNYKDFFSITPNLIKGNQNIYKLIIDKIKNKLM